MSAPSTFLSQLKSAPGGVLAAAGLVGAGAAVLAAHLSGGWWPVVGYKCQRRRRMGHSSGTVQGSAGDTNAMRWEAVGDCKARALKSSACGFACGLAAADPRRLPSVCCRSSFLRRQDRQVPLQRRTDKRGVGGGEE